MTITEIIARLGHACGLPWAMCGNRLSIASRIECHRARGHAGSCTGDSDDGPVYWIGTDRTHTPPTLAEWHAEWRSSKCDMECGHPDNDVETMVGGHWPDCAAHHAPGPVASWTSEDGRVSWSVSRNRAQGIVVHVDILGVAGIASAVKIGNSEPSFTGAGLASMAECVRLMQAADGGGT